MPASRGHVNPFIEMKRYSFFSSAHFPERMQLRRVRAPSREDR
jgi:hypothetical protein